MIWIRVCNTVETSVECIPVNAISVILGTLVFSHGGLFVTFLAAMNSVMTNSTNSDQVLCGVFAAPCMMSFMMQFQTL
jgi:hypothetical protein